MDISAGKWLSELGMDDVYYSGLDYQYQMSPFDYSLQLESLNNFHYSNSNHLDTNNLACGSATASPVLQEASHHIDHDYQRPTKQIKIMTNTRKSCTDTNYDNNNIITSKGSSSSSSPSSQIISFDNSSADANIIKPKVEVVDNGLFMLNYPPKYDQGTNMAITASAAPSRRSPLHAQDHVMAERKRREKLSLRFIALSAIVPGLKKMDKASVLGDAIKYLKQLQERVKTLEEQASKKTMESVVFNKKSVYMDDENLDTESDHPLPEIEARVSHKDVLIRIHCENHKGCVVNILSQMEKLKLSVVNTSVLPFGNSTMDITVLAQMEEEFSMTVKDLVRKLREGLLKLMQNSI
ncbi:transcription factor bHLH18-like [Tripterygium wilfordii]|uniref:Transcription factor bHLH18-like n=2 Tax=Tripterygium wilfordii TaxID=458696 RepID=A0A7J7CVG9_TRIWF|nr:transcription factor bHLH18-like [Tripterygium wilfordii]